MKDDKRVPMQGGYIIEAMRKHFLNGDCFIMAEELFGICKDSPEPINYHVYAG